MQASDLITADQNLTVNKLVKKGFRVNTVFHAHDEDVVEVMMSRKRGPSTMYADVDSNGLVNGISAIQYIINLCNLNR